MAIVKAIILGIVQGLSEFLPISSSGHLVIVEHILNFTEGGLAFEVFVHFGTLLAVVWVFRKDLLKM
ncbi:MAG: undecaprenyl-diphosphate phosphatase, partial [Calditrichia bacterium]